MVLRHAGMTVAVLAVIAFGARQVGAQSMKERSAVGQPSIADSLLTQNVWTMIKIWAGAGEQPAGCTDSLQLGTRAIAEAPKGGDARKNPWVEHWAVNRCGTEAVYRVAFTPGRGGTQFNIAPLARH